MEAQAQFKAGHNLEALKSYSALLPAFQSSDDYGDIFVNFLCAATHAADPQLKEQAAKQGDERVRANQHSREMLFNLGTLQVSMHRNDEASAALKRVQKMVEGDQMTDEDREDLIMIQAQQDCLDLTRND